MNNEILYVCDGSFTAGFSAKVAVLEVSGVFGRSIGQGEIKMGYSSRYEQGWDHAAICYSRRGLGAVRLADCAFAMGRADWSVLPANIDVHDALSREYQRGWQEFTSHHRREDYYDAHVKAWEKR